MRQIDAEMVFEDENGNELPEPLYKLEDGTTLNVVRITSVDHRADPSEVAMAIVALIHEDDDGLSTKLTDSQEVVELQLGDDSYHWAVVEQ